MSDFDSGVLIFPQMISEAKITVRWSPTAFAVPESVKEAREETLLCQVSYKRVLLNLR